MREAVGDADGEGLNPQRAEPSPSPCGRASDCVAVLDTKRDKVGRKTRATRLHEPRGFCFTTPVAHRRHLGVGTCRAGGHQRVGPVRRAAGRSRFGASSSRSGRLLCDEGYGSRSRYRSSVLFARPMRRQFCTLTHSRPGSARPGSEERFTEYPLSVAPVKPSASACRACPRLRGGLADCEMRRRSCGDCD